MISFHSIVIWTLCFVGFSLSFAQTAPHNNTPTAHQLGWTQTKGGEEGREIQVTTLSSRGPGSLAEALSAKGPRKVVFAIAGVIDLNFQALKINEPHLTIAGETAPPPGITLIRGGLQVATHDVIVRHLRVRAGDGGRAKKSGWEIDGLSTVGGAHDVIVDHCSFSWCTDENLSASGPRFEGKDEAAWRANTSHRITFSNNIVGEGLHQSTHAKGGHSMGTLIHDTTTEIAVVSNLYISNNARNPLFKGGARGVVVNNFIHNPGSMGIAFALVPEEWEGQRWPRGQIAIVGNVIQRGPSTIPHFAPIRFGSDGGVGECDAFVSDNLFMENPSSTAPAAISVISPSKAKPRSEFRLVPTPPTWPSRLNARPASDVSSSVLTNAGARPWDRDAVDRRLIEEARSAQGRIIHSQDEVEGYPALRQ